MDELFLAVKMVPFAYCCSGQGHQIGAGSNVMPCYNYYNFPLHVYYHLTMYIKHSFCIISLTTICCSFLYWQIFTNSICFTPIFTHLFNRAFISLSFGCTHTVDKNYLFTFHAILWKSFFGDQLSLSSATLLQFRTRDLCIMLYLLPRFRCIA